MVTIREYASRPHFDEFAVKEAVTKLSMNERMPASASVAAAAAGAEDELPLLVSDNDDYSDDESCSSRDSSDNVVEAIKRDLKDEASDKEDSAEEASAATEAALPHMKQPLTAEQFARERTHLMTIVVKYVATKIKNSVPQLSLRASPGDHLALDKFLLILTSRLNLSMSMFMQGMIYLFRYIDIIYLLRYLNQSNNFANYNEMQYSVKKLIVGCFKLVCDNNLVCKEWAALSGLRDNEITDVVAVLTTRMNGKLRIKPVELVKFKSEIFRFVKMVTRAV